MKHLDIYRWYYKKSIVPGITATSYWCASQIGVVIHDKLIDTYWGWPPERDSTDGRKWTLDQAQEKLDLEFIANLNDLEVLTDIPDYYDNVIDLTHRNTLQNLRFIRKGQQRSEQAMIKFYDQQIIELQHDIEYKTYELLSVQNRVENLKQLMKDREMNHEKQK